MKLETQTLLGNTIHFEILDKDGKVREKTWVYKNVILDYGMNELAENSLMSCFSFCALGDGTLPFKKDSGTITFSRSGNTVTASSSFFESGDVGCILKFDTGQEMTITSYSSPTSVTVNSSGTIALSEGTLYYVQRNSLQNEVMRFSTAVTAEETSFYLDGVITSIIVRLSNVFTSTKTISEVGFARLSTGNIFNGLNITSPLTVYNGEQIKVILTSQRYISPTVAVDYENLITGWEETGQMVIEGWTGFSNKLSGYTSESFLDSGTNKTFFICKSTTALRSPSIGGYLINPGDYDTSIKNMTKAAYVPNSYMTEFTVSFLPLDYASTSIRSIGFGQSAGGQVVSYVRYRMNENHTKTNSETLNITAQFIWSRQLVN